VECFPGSVIFSGHVVAVRLGLADLPFRTNKAKLLQLLRAKDEKPTNVKVLLSC
jgi:hypothetical protein